MPGKLGYGLYKQSEQYADEAADSGATVVLLMDDALRHAARIKQRNPRIVIVGRGYVEEGEQIRLISLPQAERYRHFYDWGYRLAVAYPAVDTWQALNEMYSPGNFVVLEGQAAAELAFADGVSAAGRTLTAFNFAPASYPVPGEGDFPRFASTIRPVLAHPACGFFGIHVYGSRDQRKLQLDTYWHTLRYRRLLSGLRGSGVPVPPVIITEYGQESGWRTIPNFGEVEAAKDYIWFGQALDFDPEIFGGANFLHGTVDPGRWHGFDTAGTQIMYWVSRWNKGLSVFDIPAKCAEGWRLDPTSGICVPDTLPTPSPPSQLAVVATLGMVAATGLAVAAVLREEE